MKFTAWKRQIKTKKRSFVLRGEGSFTARGSVMVYASVMEIPCTLVVLQKFDLGWKMECTS